MTDPQIRRLAQTELEQLPIMDAGMFKHLLALYREDTDALGLVVLDPFDGDYGYVVLRRVPEKTFRAFDVDASFPTLERARESLEHALLGEAGDNPLPDFFAKDEERLSLE
jgi:hypothetical protein